MGRDLHELFTLYCILHGGLWLYVWLQIPEHIPFILQYLTVISAIFTFWLALHQAVNLPYIFGNIHMLLLHFFKIGYRDFSDVRWPPRITVSATVCSTVCSGERQRKYQSAVLLPFVRGIQWRPVNSPKKGSVIRKMISWHDVFMIYELSEWIRIDYLPICFRVLMMTSLNGNTFCVTGPLCGEFTGHRWFSLTKAIDADLWCFLWSASE